MNELISVIVPVYKVEEYLRRCIDSIINQTYRNLEIILVDDGSPDNCGKICDEYALLDKRIKVIHKENGGQSEARNYGLKIAKGKYFGFIDSDDYIKEDMYENLYNLLIKYDADISMCNIVKKSNNKNEIMENYKEIEKYDTKSSLLELLDDHITNYIYNKLYKREIWNNIEFSVGIILEDMDVMYKILEKSKKIICTNKTEYYYCIRNNSSIAIVNSKVTGNLKDVINRRHTYLNNKYQYLSEKLMIIKLMSIFKYHDNLSICGDFKTYNSTEYIEEYKFYKDNFKKYKDKLYNNSFRKKDETYILYYNRTIFYIYCRIKNLIKKLLNLIKFNN